MTATLLSAIEAGSPALRPYFPSDGSSPESETLKAVIRKLNMQEHPEGGYFVETDRDPWRVKNPFLQKLNDSSLKAPDDSRSACTSIHYLLTPRSPLGHFHRNKARTVHTLHRGRGRYVIIHADEVGSPVNPGGYGASEDVPECRNWIGKARVETFLVGHDVLKGERLQWIVEGGKYKCSYLLPDDEGGDTSEGLLISETVVPGFEYSDHDFMTEARMQALATDEQYREMGWMLRKVVGAAVEMGTKN